MSAEYAKRNFEYDIYRDNFCREVVYSNSIAKFPLNREVVLLFGESNATLFHFEVMNYAFELCISK